MRGPAKTDDDAGRVNCPSQPGKARAGADFTAVPNFNVTIPAGQSAARGKFNFTVTDDRLVEGEERLTVTARLGDASATGRLSIADDDAAPSDLRLSLVPAFTTRDGPEVPMREGGLARSYLISAAVPPGQGLLSSPSTVTLSVGGGTASSNDYSVSMLPDNTVLVPAGPVTNLGPGAQPADLQVLLVVTPLSDRAVEGLESLVVSGTATGGLNVAPVTLAINDAAGSTPDRISLTLDRSEVEEGAGTVRLGVTARMFCQSGACSVLAEDRTVNLELSESLSTAAADDDFVLGSGSVTIPAGSYSGSAQLELRVLDDRLVEGNESVAVGGSAFGFQVNAATVLITDDEPAAGELDLRFKPGDGGRRGRPGAVGADRRMAGRFERDIRHGGVGGAGRRFGGGRDRLRVAGSGKVRLDDSGGPFQRVGGGGHVAVGGRPGGGRVGNL